MTQTTAPAGIQRIIVETGGCGRFQIILCFIVHSMKCIACFSIVHMMFGSMVPDWWCLDGISLENVTSDHGVVNISADNFKACTVGNGTACTNFYFDKSLSTLISEFTLVCDKDWIPTTIMSVQMAGVFIGNALSGQVADVIGRKTPLFLSILSLVILNIIAPFSVSWLMFTVLRFFIGAACGVLFTVMYNIQSEFADSRWRSYIVAIPSWPVDSALFVLAAWLLKDWKNLHFVGAATGIPWLFTYWFVPESYRWYLSHNRIADAKKVIEKIARTNNRKDFVLDESDLVLDADGDTKDRKYSFLDLVKNLRMFKLTSLLLVLWMTVGLGSYGIQFGVPKLAGDFYLNSVIISILGSPLQLINIVAMNKFGRKPTVLFFFVAFAITALIVGIAARLEETPTINTVSNVAALAALTAVNAAWTPLQTLTLELYPTVVRNIGYGVQNTMSRVGAILGPQLLFLDSKVSGLMFFVCAGVSACSVLLLLPLPETKAHDLNDKIETKKPAKTKHALIV